MRMTCSDGSPCSTGSPLCYAPIAGLCGRSKYAAIVARETRAREAASLAGDSILPTRPTVMAATAEARGVIAPRPGTMTLGSPLDPWTFVTTSRLAQDTQRLITALPPDIDLVVGVSRSGLLPASIVAFGLHVPLWSVSRSAGLVDPGRGTRLGPSSNSFRPRHILLLDDTAASGHEMRSCAPLVALGFPGARITRAVVYAHPQAQREIDLAVALLSGSHYLEWNWANAGHGSATAFDFDGILCRDFTEREASDPDRYLTAMAAMPPLFLPRRMPIPLIVTGRPESSRAVTLAWLARWGLSVEHLVMRAWAEPWDHGTTRRMAEFKAEHYARSGAVLFAESDPAQAAILAEISGKAVLCPAMGRVIPSALDQLRSRVDACPDRGCKTGCQHAVCRRHAREVYIDECFSCVGGPSDGRP